MPDEPNIFSVVDDGADENDDTGIVFEEEPAFEAGDTLTYARTGRFKPRRPPESFGDRMGRWSWICAAMTVPASFCPVIGLAPLVAGFGTGIVALFVTRGRSIGGWIGFIICGAVIAMIAWVVATGR